MRLDRIINEYKDELYDHVVCDLCLPFEREYNYIKHDIVITCKKTTVQVIVYEKDGTDVTHRYSNICESIKKKLANAWQDIASEIETEDEHIDYWAMFGGYGANGRTITLMTL